jgi:hypothetical protein
MLQGDQVSTLSQLAQVSLGSTSHTSYPALKLNPSKYGLCRFLLLRNLLRTALRRETRSSLGSGAEEHRESRALYRAIAAEELVFVMRNATSKSVPATRCCVDLLGWRNWGMHESVVWCHFVARKTGNISRLSHDHVYLTMNR